MCVFAVCVDMILNDIFSCGYERECDDDERQTGCMLQCVLPSVYMIITVVV